jgi:hypothetical protein
MMCSLSRLEPKELDTIQSLEQEVGRPLLAFSCHDIKAAELRDEQLAKIRDLEAKLGIYLVAIEG